jgi:hypothetical protein
MYKLEENLIDYLQRINFILKNEVILTECIKSVEGFTIFGENFGPFEREKRYKMPLFKAIPFIENNILSIAQSEKCDNIDVQRYVYEERDNERLIKRDNKYFLNKIKDFKRFLEREVKEGKKPQEFLNNFSSYLMNLIDRRLFKVLKISRTELSFDEERTLTKSEQILYNQIYKLIRDWRKFFLT